jgi:hypothetical protein
MKGVNMMAEENRIFEPFVDIMLVTLQIDASSNAFSALDLDVFLLWSYGWFPASAWTKYAGLQNNKLTDSALHRSKETLS